MLSKVCLFAGLLLSKKAKLKNQKFMQTSPWDVDIISGLQIGFDWFLKGTWVLSFGSPQALPYCNSLSQYTSCPTWLLESGTVSPSNFIEHFKKWYMCICWQAVACVTGSASKPEVSHRNPCLYWVMGHPATCNCWQVLDNSMCSDSSGWRTKDIVWTMQKFSQIFNNSCSVCGAIIITCVFHCY